jgi:two-component system response regulator PilR (NtrC family)
MPALRDRPEDIPEFCRHILRRLALEYGQSQPALSATAENALLCHDYPGNVRELENILERAFTLCEHGRIEAADLGITFPVNSGAATEPGERSAALLAVEQLPLSGDFCLPEGESLEGFLERIERKLLTEALEANRWNKTAAAKQLGISFRALRYRLTKLHME